MKITDYPQIPQLAEDNVFLVDGPSGTKIIRADNLITLLLNMLDPVDFIGYIDLTKLSKVVTLASENLILVADEDGNKAMIADKAAENLLKLMNATDFSKKLSPASLEANQDIADDDVLVMGDAENGVRKITGENAAQSMLSLANQTNFTKKVKPSLLTANLDLASNDQLLMEDVNDGTRKISASAAAKSLLALMDETEFADKLDVTEYAAVNVITNTDEFLIKTANGLKRVVYSDLKEIIKKPDNYYTKRYIYRRKDLGATITQSMMDDISSGVFEQFFIGDFFNSFATYRYCRYWDVADFNYWKGRGNKSVSSNHIAIMSRNRSSSQTTKYNNEASIGGYKTSALHDYLLDQVWDYGVPSFLKSRSIVFNELITSSAGDTNDNYAIEWASMNAIVPSLANLYGYVYLNVNGFPGQLALCQFLNGPDFSGEANKSYWLRDLYTKNYAYYISEQGNIGVSPFSSSYFCNVLFAIH